MPLGLDYGLIAALCWGSTDVLGTIGGRRLGSLPVVAIAQAASLVFVLVLAAMQGAGLPSDPGVLAASVFFGAVAAGAYRRSSRRSGSAPWPSSARSSPRMAA